MKEHVYLILLLALLSLGSCRSKRVETQQHEYADTTHVAYTATTRNVSDTDIWWLNKAEADSAAITLEADSITASGGAIIYRPLIKVNLHKPATATKMTVKYSGEDESACAITADASTSLVTESTDSSHTDSASGTNVFIILFLISAVLIVTAILKKY